MAVYTQLSIEEIQTLADRLGIGQLLAAQGVTAGVENTTYFLTTASPPTLLNTSSEYVLTVAETISAEELRFIATLSAMLSEQNLPVPAPLIDESGIAVFNLAGKPAVVVPKITGTHPQHPTIAQCESIGSELAHLHLVTLTAGLSHESHRSLRWVADTGTRLLNRLDLTNQTLLSEELAFLQMFTSANQDLPQAVIHGDLFRDNALFVRDKLAAIIDFFSAGTGFLLLDLAIVVNDWCRVGEKFLPEHLRALSAGYAHIRPITASEIEEWPDLLRLAALRFWVSRLAEAHLLDDSRSIERGKNPEEYRDLLIQHRDNPLQWDAA
jgi:homoserine kinase type II